MRLSFDIQAWLWATGIEHQPGPGQGKILRRLTRKQAAPHFITPAAPQDRTLGSTCARALPFLLGDHWPGNSDLCHVEIKNVTSLVTFGDGMARRAAHLSLVQEHSCIPSKLAIAKATFREHFGKLLLAGPLDPNCSTPTGGMAAISDETNTLFDVPPEAPSFAKAIGTGRAQLIAFGKGKSSDLVHFYNFYGHSGGHENKWKAKGTSAIVQACIDDFMLRPPGARFLVGDLNADPDDIAAILALLADLHWVDVGSIASTWGSPDCQATCTTKGANQPTRRDFVFASPEALGLIKGFKVMGEDLCPTHATLTLLLDLEEAEYSTYRARKQRELPLLVHEAFRTGHGSPPSPINKEDILHRDADAELAPEAPHPFVKHLINADFKIAAEDYAAKEDLFIHQLKTYMDANVIAAARHLR